MSAVAEPHVGRALRRKEDPRLITGRGRYIDDISLPGTLWAAFVRSPEAHAKIVSIDASAAARAPGVHAVFTGAGHGRPRRSAADGLGAARRRGQQPRALAAGQGRSSGTSAIRSRSCSAMTATRSSMPPRTSSSNTSRCRSSPIRRRRSRAAPFVHEELGTNKVHEWSLAGGDLEAGFAEADVVVERRVVNHRTAGAPIEPRGVLADYRAGSADAVELDPGAALRAPVPRDPARDERGARPRDRARGRRRLRLEAPGLRRGDPRLLGLAQARPAGQVDRDADREHGGHPPGSRPDLAREDGRQARRHGDRLPREDHRRLRRLQHAADAADPVAGGVRDGRLLQDPGRPDRHRRRVHEQVPDGRDPRRRPARGDAHDRGDARPDGGASSGWTRSRSGARTSSRKEDFPAAVATGVVYDSGDYDKTLDRLLEHVDVAGVPPRAGGAARAGHLPRHRASRPTPRSAAWRRRGSPVPAASASRPAAGSRRWSASTTPARSPSTPAARRHGQGHETAFAQIVADRLGRRPGGTSRCIHGDTGDRARGPQHVRLALAGGRRRGAGQVRRQDRRQGQGDRRPPARGGTGGHRGRRRQVLGQGLAGQGHDARRGGRRRVPQPGPGRDGARARGDDVLRPGELRVPVRRPRLRSSTSTPRPARSRSCGTSPSTTAATRSTRC